MGLARACRESRLGGGHKPGVQTQPRTKHLCEKGWREPALLCTPVKSNLLSCASEPKTGDVRETHPHLWEAVLCRQRASPLPEAEGKPVSREECSAGLPGSSQAVGTSEGLAKTVTCTTPGRTDARTHGRLSSKDKKSSTGRKHVEDTLRTLQNPEFGEWFRGRLLREKGHLRPGHS